MIDTEDSTHNLDKPKEITQKDEGESLPSRHCSSVTDVRSSSITRKIKMRSYSTINPPH